MNGVRAGCAAALFLSALSLVAHDAASQELPPQTLSVAEYVRRLDDLITAIEAPRSSGDLAAHAVEIPPVWHVRSEQRTFEVPTDWVRDDLREWRTAAKSEARQRLLERLRTVRADAASFEAPPADTAAARAELADILRAREFRGLHGTTWVDELRQRVVRWFSELLGRLFASSAIPVVSSALVYGLIGIAVIVFALWTYRFLRRSAAIETIVPDRTTLPAKEWTAWLADAQAAAARGEWRDAIHFAYWCAVFFLEAKGGWRPDATRTPREYLRQLPPGSSDGSALAALTRRFELTWYGVTAADAQAFNESIDSLKKLGCPTA